MKEAIDCEKEHQKEVEAMLIEVKERMQNSVQVLQVLFNEDFTLPDDATYVSSTVIEAAKELIEGCKLTTSLIVKD